MTSEGRQTSGQQGGRALAGQIDVVCDSFEAEWKRGNSPSIESYLIKVPVADRQSLLRELLLIEIEYRARSENTPSIEDYRSRFPVELETINQAFQQQSTARSLHSSDSDPESKTDEANASDLGRFRLLKLLGQGGMGSVYLAQHAHLKRKVAVKVLSARLMDDEQSVARFRREMEAVGQLDHPNIVRALDADKIDDTHVLIMEYVDGVDLAKIAQRCGRLSIDDASEVIRQAALGLEYAHRNGLVHRDIKPANLMLAPGGRVKLLDLGLALLRAPQDTDPQFTSTGMIMGTVDYISPEQTLDAHSVDARADVYSLGCSLYQLLSGEVPYHGDRFNTMGKRIMAHTNEPVPDIRERHPEIPKPLAELVMQMMSKEPADRPATASDVAIALEPFTKNADLGSLWEDNTDTESSSAEIKQDTFDHLASSYTETSVTKKNLQAVPSRRFLWPGIAGVIGLLIIAGLYLAGVLFKIDTPSGTLVIEVSEPDAEVRILDENQKVLITRKSGKESLILNLQPVKGKIQVIKDGFTIETREFVLTDVGQEAIKVTLLPVPDAPAQPTDANPMIANTIDWKPGPTEGVLSGFIQRPAKLPGTESWNIDTVQPRGPRFFSISPDSTRVACSAHGKVYIHQLPNLELVQVLVADENGVSRIDWSPNGKLIAGQIGKKIQLWEAATGVPLRVLPGHKVGIYSMAWSPDSQRLATSDFFGDGFLKIWDVTGKLIREINIGVTAAAGISWSPDGKWIANGSNSRLNVWNVADGERVHVFGLSGPVTSSAWSPDGKWLAASNGQGNGTGNGKFLHLWHTDTWEPGPDLVGNASFVNQVAWHQDSTRLLTAGQDTSIRLFDINGKHSWVGGLRETQIIGIEWSRDGEWYVSVGSDAMLRVWDATDHKQVCAIGHKVQPILGIAVSPDGKSIALTNQEKQIRLLETEPVRHHHFLSGHTDQVNVVTWNSDGDLLASGGNDQTIRIWILPGGLAQSTLKAHSGEITSVAWSPDDSSLVSGAVDQQVIVWDLKREKPQLTLDAGGRVIRVLWSPDKQWIAASTAGHKLRIWNADDGEEVDTYETGDSAVAWSPDSKWLATGDGQHALRLLSTKHWTLTEPLQGKNEHVTFAVWSHDSHWLAAGGNRGVDLWNLENPSANKHLAGNQGMVHSLAWQPTQSSFYSGNADGTLRLWDATTGHQQSLSLLFPESVTTLDAAGQLQGEPTAEFDEKMIYLLQQKSGAVNILTPTKFHQKFAAP